MMDWLQEHWQTIAALAIVALTVAIFAVRLARSPSRKAGGCGGGCDCELKPGAHRK